MHHGVQLQAACKLADAGLQTLLALQVDMKMMQDSVMRLPLMSHFLKAPP